jgi:hypothetical protein
LSTSLDTLSANIAINTIYIKFIMRWRGETGFFFTAIRIGREVMK